MIPYEVRYWLYSLYYRNKELMMKLAFVALVIALAFVSCSYLNKQLNLPEDHPIEQLTEFVIEQQTGLDIDLTP